VELKDEAPFIGFIALAEPSFEAHFTPCVEIGWRLAKAYWGRGLAPEGARVVLDYAFDRLGLEEVVSFTAATNTPSRWVMEKLGMSRDPAEDFDHPRIAPGHPLCRHVLYRIRLRPWEAEKPCQCRRALPGDGAGLAEVQVRSWRAAYRGRVADAYLQGLSVEQKAGGWEKVLQSDASFTLLAQEKAGQKIVGFITLGPCRDGDAPRDGLLELRALYIDPDHWRRGLGRQLTRLAMEECRQRKARRLVLWVLESNQEAQTFYQALGFRRDGGVKVDDRIEACPPVEWRYSRDL
jgi:RimJ/RimL family protein N-acetyltransferase